MMALVISLKDNSIRTQYLALYADNKLLFFIYPMYLSDRDAVYGRT